MTIPLALATISICPSVSHKTVVIIKKTIVQKVNLPRGLTGESSISLKAGLNSYESLIFETAPSIFSFIFSKNLCIY